MQILHNLCLEYKDQFGRSINFSFGDGKSRERRLWVARRGRYMFTIFTTIRGSILSRFALAKYTGCYDRWKQIQQSFQLKWSNGDSLQAFTSIFNNEKDFDYMLSWLKGTCFRLPKQFASVLIFNTLTGLRPSEAYMAITLTHHNMENYLNHETQTFEHFRFPYFIRRTKKAYISICNNQIIEIAKDTGSEVTYNSIKQIFKRLDLDLHMAFCRKIFATFLRTHGVEQELIDLLQGRFPRNVFVRNYYRPNFIEETKRVSILLIELYQKIRC